MDQGSYLSKALWHYRSISKHTDLILLCKNGSLSAHSALLAPFLTSLGMKFASNDELPDYCLVLPDLDTNEVEGELKKIYRGHKATVLFELLRSTESTIKMEISNYMDEEEEAKPFENYHLDNKETLHDDDDDDSYQGEDEPCVTKTDDVVKEETKEKSTKSSSNVKSKRPSRSPQKSKVMKCNKCGDECDGMGALLAHVKEFHGKTGEVDEGGKNWNDMRHCPYCEKKIKGRQSFKIHLATLHREEMILNHPDIELSRPCPDCELMFFGVADLDKHTRNVHSKSSIEWNCQFCDDKFGTKGQLTAHRKERHVEECLEAGIKSIFDVKQCPYCETKCSTTKALNTHIFHVHEEKRGDHPKKKFKFVCTHCKSGKYQKEALLAQHILENHSGKEYYCSQCPMIFHTPQQRGIHERRNHSEKKIKCDQCDMMFSTPSYRNAHFKMVHVKEPDRICPHCGEGFRDKILFEAHVNRHLGHRPHACELCGKTYLTERDLKSHIDTHTLPYQCDKCDVRTGSKTLLKDHMRVVHDGIQLGCR